MEENENIEVCGAEQGGAEQNASFAPFVANIKIEKKEYMKLSMVNLKRYLGVKELILYLLLLGAGLGLYFGFRIWLFLLLFGIVNLLAVISVGVFFGTASAGYKYEFLKTGVARERIVFDRDGILVQNLDAEGKIVFEEMHEKQNIDKLAFGKDKIYIFRSTAVYYYVKKEDVEDGRFYELEDYLKAAYPPVTFHLRKKIKQYPGYNNKE